MKNEIKRNERESEYFEMFKDSFTDVLASTASKKWKSIIVGSGMTVSQTSGTLVITSGTAANEETILRSKQKFTGNFVLKNHSILSQRIANNNFVCEFVDIIGDGLNVTVNSDTSITIKIQNVNTTSHDILTASSVGQFLSIGAIVGIAGAIPGRYPIESVSEGNVTLTVSGWPASGTGTASLYGYNFYRTNYDSTTATQVKFDVGRSGWAAGDTTATCSTTASPGNIIIMTSDNGNVTLATGLIASSTSVPETLRASRVGVVPDSNVELYLQLRVTNGSTNPASTTTWTHTFVSVEEYSPKIVSIQSIRNQQAIGAMPVTVTTLPAVAGAAAHDGAVSGSPVRVAGRALSANYTAVSTGDTADLVTSLVGALVVKPYSIPALDWFYAAPASGLVNTTTAVQIKAAAASGIRNYITGIDLQWEALTNATEFAIRDGAGGSAIWRFKIGASSAGNRSIQFPSPIYGTAATLLEIVTLTASGAGAVYANVYGFAAP